MTPCMWTSIYVEISPEDAVRRVAANGFRAIELSTEHLEILRDSPNRAQRLADFGTLVADCGLLMDQAHITISVDVSALDPAKRLHDQETVLRDIEVLATLGISAGVIHPGGYGKRDTPALVDEQNAVRVEAFRKLGSAAEQAGVRLAIENGGGNTGPDDQPTWHGHVDGLRELIAQVDSPALGICVDTGHAILENWNPAESIRHAGELLIATHIADNDGSGDQHRIPYSYGSKVDWVDVAAALGEVAYTGPFNFEIPGERGRPYEIIDARVRHALEIANVLLFEGIGPQPAPWQG